MRLVLLMTLISSLLSSCVSYRFYALKYKEVVTPADFTGVYVPHERMTRQQLRMFGTKIHISDSVPKEIIAQLLSPTNGKQDTYPALSMEITKEYEGPNLAEAKTQYYYLGINKSPVDFVHYDFDNGYNAFERTSTTLKKNVLTHDKKIQIYKRAEENPSIKEGGFHQIHQLKLYDRILVLTHEISEYDEPWSEVFPAAEGNPEGTVSATFIRVEKPQYEAHSSYSIRNQFER